MEEDVGTSKPKRGQEVNIGPKFKQTTSISTYISKYKDLYLCRVI